jgi:hypothetical protein
MKSVKYKSVPIIIFLKYRTFAPLFKYKVIDLWLREPE